MGRGVARTDGRDHLRGRDRECQELDALVDAVRRGEGRSLILKGEAGIGKTALLEYVTSAADDLTVISASGVESEMELAFASLHQLCAPLLHRLDELPGPQRDALQTVFGLVPGPVPDRFLVGLASLTLFSQAADERPLLIVVDDAQWLDHASASTLAFVTRRLLAECVGLVFAARTLGPELRHLPGLQVHGLVNGDARALLDSAIPFRLDEHVRDRLLAETRGNPLALLELPRGRSPTQLAGGFGIADSSEVSRRVEVEFATRIEGLSTTARALLVVAAAEPVGDSLLLQRACQVLGIAPSDAEGTDGLLSWGERVTFRHPLVRSAVYQAASPAERRSAHIVLAQVTNRDEDPDRRAWHLAAATVGPDEGVATELELSAERARARGGQAAAAAFLQRAVALTADPTRRAGRAIAAAQANLAAGAFDGARRLLAVAEVGPLDDLGRARVTLLRADIVFAERRDGEAPLLLLTAAKHLERLDIRLARDTYLEAWGAALFAGHFAVPGGTLHDVSSAAVAAGRPVDGPLARDLLLDGLAMLFTDGMTAATPPMKAAVCAFCTDEASVDEVMRWGWLAARAAIWMWDHDSALEVSRRAVQFARDTGALEVLAVADNVLGQSATWGGDFELAAQLAAEVEAVKEATGSRIGPYAAISLVGFRGREAEATALLDAVAAGTTAAHQGTAAQYAQWARAVLMNGLGRYDEALTAASNALDGTAEFFAGTWALGELVEAATRLGRVDVARRSVAELERRIVEGDSDWALGFRSLARALASVDTDAELAYRDAIERLGRTRLRPHHARARLLYGEWLRRMNRRIDARAELRAAHELFEDIGMEAFAARARSELAATGERVRTRSVDTMYELTPQERQIAALAAAGRSNPEIGAQLFLSARTVEWHLGNVFGKLGIRSRRELARALPVDGPASVGGGRTTTR